MGRIQATIPEELERKLRIALAQRYGWRKGALKEATVQALSAWLLGDVAIIYLCYGSSSGP